ncbi:MAG: serine/threonine-protein kinase [Deltaproteobacteria bacterium]|nr:serine/threonine-protein kinase [Myxococcales bacterium]MDP3216982.1 serine/threonine-protein kinase [Deltaproteobacteria bacterium]
MLTNECRAHEASISTMKVERDPGARFERTLAAVEPGMDDDPELAARLEGLPQIVDDGPGGAGEYTPLEVVAVGGLGVVERARQRSTGREVSIKRVRHPSTPGAARMLLEEGRAMAELRHPGIAPLLAVGRDGRGQPVLVIRWVEGATWRALLHDPGHPGWRDHPGDRLALHLRVLAQVAAAAHYAHGLGWLHRDIKPDNVMVGPHGDAYLIDWGLAVHLPVVETEDFHSLVGTPGYMVPEMVRGAGPWLSPGTDVYLLGAALHEVLTGHARHEGHSLREALFSAWVSAPCAYPDGTPAALAALANEATSARPEQRPPSADAFRRRIEDYLGHSAAQGAIERGRERFERLRAASLAHDGLLGRLDACAATLRRGLEWWPALPAPVIAVAGPFAATPPSHHEARVCDPPVRR